VWEDVFSAFEDLAASPFPLEVASLMKEWAETRNPYWADYAVVRCKEESVPIPPMMIPLLGTIAYQRLSGETQGGTPDAVAKKLLYGRAYRLMANLCSVGLTKAVAASKAAHDLRSVANLENPPKASTLERNFKGSPWYHKIEELRASHLRYGRFETWREIAETLPRSDEEHEGSRR
jgi:hypothetical protein